MNCTAKNFIAIIVAGGFGSRIKKYSNLPKCLFKFKKKSLLELIYNNLINYKIKDITLLSHYKSHLISKFIKIKNLKINLTKETKPLGTAGCLNLVNTKKKYFLIIFGDLLFKLNFKNLINYHFFKKSDLTVLAHPNSHPFDSDLINHDANYRIRNILKKPHNKNLIYSNLVMAGVFIVNKNMLKYITNKKKSDFTKDFIASLIKKRKKIFAMVSREYCKDMGTPERYLSTLKDYKNNFHNKYSANRKIPVIFLDKDGVINEDLGPFKYSNPLNMFSEVPSALKLINNSNYLSIVITNQPHVAKGFITIKNLLLSFKKLETFLGNKNIYLDKIFYCPHHPNLGYPGEIKSLKIKCSCRKPDIGLFFKAHKEFNIDFKRSYFIGNSEVDYNAALNCGVKPIIIRNKLFNVKGVIKKDNLLQAVEYILKKRISNNF